MTDRKPTVVVAPDDTLPKVVAQLREAARGGEFVALVVPIDSALLLTAREFRTLKEAIDEERLAVLVRTADPLRLQLAERLGIRAQGLPRPRVAAATVTAPPPPPAFQPDQPAASIGDWPGETARAGSARNPDPGLSWPRQSDAEEETPDAALIVEGEAPEAETAPGVANPPRRWLPVAAALAVLVAVAFLAIRFLVPQATVRIVPKSAPVVGSVAFDVTADGEPLDDAAAFAIAPQTRQIAVAWEGSVPATGLRVEPDGTASSGIELRNASAAPLTVDAGTIVATETGIEFAFSEAVTVPAADPASGEPGAATGRVQGVAPGSAGNVGTGELGGRLPNGVYYSNRMAPAEGGTDKEFPMIAQADLDALTAAARAAAPALAAAALESEYPGEELLPATVTVTESADAFDHQVGDEDESVALRATMTVEVLTYDGAAAEGEYETLLAQRLSDDAPPGFAIGPEDIIFDAPVTTEESDRGMRLEVTARGEAEAVLDDRERATLADALAGADPDQAAVILARTPDVAEYRVEYHPSWLAPRMPNTAARIQFEIAE